MENFVKVLITVQAYEIIMRLLPEESLWPCATIIILFTIRFQQLFRYIF
jgi:hypothetical protein